MCQPLIELAPYTYKRLYNIKFRSMSCFLCLLSANGYSGDLNFLFCAWCGVIFFLRSLHPQMWYFKTARFLEIISWVLYHLKCWVILSSLLQKWTSPSNASSNKFLFSLMKCDRMSFFLLLCYFFKVPCQVSRCILCFLSEECLQRKKKMRDSVCNEIWHKLPKFKHLNMPPARKVGAELCTMS